MDERQERDLLSHCTLCPRRCGVDRTAGQTGYCGALAEVQCARAALHFWEEPCISGTRGAGTVFFSHCTLGCVYCQNAPISRGGRGKTVTNKRLGEIFLELQAQGAHNIDLVTPMHYAPQVVRALEDAREKGLAVPAAVNCGGYELPETVRLFSDTARIWMPDFKYASSARARDYSAAPDYPERALAAIDEMLRQTGPAVIGADGLLTCGVLIRHLLLPGGLADSMRAVRLLWERYGDDVILSLMSQYTPMGENVRYPMLSRRVPRRHYEALVEYAASLGVTRCYTQEESAADEGFIPPFDGEGV